ncbi:MAG: hypothetical protein ACREMZ_05620 [Gemmatimonadales bacterium]
MERYDAIGRDTGIVAYEVGNDFIRVQFVDGSVYLYDAIRPGMNHVERMKELAVAGQGLTTYINQHVRKAYARRER